MNFCPLIALVGKDLRLFIIDARAVIIAIVAPPALATFLVIAVGQTEPGDLEASAARDGAITRIVAAMAVQFALLTAVESGVALLTERQTGLWRRIRAAPISRATLLLGRALSGATIALAVLVILLGFGAIAFGVRARGSLIGLVLICLSYAAMASSFGLLIAALGKTARAARSLSVLAVLFMVILGGAWMPTSSFPDLIRLLTPLIPTRWAIDGFDAALSPLGSLSQTLPAVIALGGFTLAFSCLARALFRWEGE